MVGCGREEKENTALKINNYVQIGKRNLKKLRCLKPDSVTDGKGTKKQGDSALGHSRDEEG